MASQLGILHSRLLNNKIFSFDCYLINKPNGKLDYYNPIIIIKNHKWKFTGRRPAYKAMMALFMMSLCRKYNRPISNYNRKRGREAFKKAVYLGRTNKEENNENRT